MFATQLDTAVDDLEAVSDRMVADRRLPATFEGVTSEAKRLRTAINKLELRFARLAGHLFEPFDDKDEDQDPIAWMRTEFHMTSHAALTAWNIAATEDALPQSIGALLNGEIGMAHLGLMARTCHFAAGWNVVQPFDETSLLGKAKRKTVYHFRKDCYHAQHAMSASMCVAGVVDQVVARHLRIEGSADEGAWLSGYLDSEGAELLRSALDPLALPGPEEARTKEQRYGDALVELLAHRLESGTIPCQAGARPHLQVTATIATLQALGGAPAGELARGGLIPDRTVQRLACDSTVSRVILNSESMVTDVGRAQRVVPPSTRRALNARDRGCRWPGCERTATWTAAHHIKHWADGGATNLDNLVLLCRRHHWQVHECEWRIVPTDAGEFVTVAPDPQMWRAPRPLLN